MSRETAKRSDLAGEAGYGYCASHSRYFWGMRLYLVATAEGMPLMWCLANPKSQREVMTALLQVDHHPVAEGQVILADKGFAGADFEQFLDGLGAHLLAQPAKALPAITNPPRWSAGCCGNASGSKRSSTPSKDNCPGTSRRPPPGRHLRPGRSTPPGHGHRDLAQHQHRGVEQTITHRLRPLTSTDFGINHLDPEWANRRRLLTGRERLRPAALERMWNELLAHDPTGQILAAWIAKEELRTLLASAREHAAPHIVRARLGAFYTWCASTNIPEVHRLASTIETWWPETLRFLETGLTNARTEGTNRVIKEVGRRACGFRNPTNHRRRVRLVCTRRPRRAPAKTSLKPC